MTAVVVAAVIAAVGATCESPYAPGPGKYPRFESKAIEPGLAYGSCDTFDLPRTILFSVTPEELLSDGGEWVRLGIGAFFVHGVGGDWSSDVWSADGEPWTIGASDRTFQRVREAAGWCRGNDCELFLTMSFSHHLEWFDDMAWPRIEDNFRQFALFAREAGCTGIALDIEYIYPQYHFSWEGYTYDGYTRRDLWETIHARMMHVASVLYEAFPDMVLLTFPEQGLSLGNVVHAAWIEEAARRRAPGGVHICTEYTYRRPNIRYMFGHAWLVNHVLEATLTDRARRYWTTSCSIAAGLWPLGLDSDDYHGQEPSVEEFRQAFAASLMTSRRYNWIYSHNLRQAILGRDAQQYTDTERVDGLRRILVAREIVTDPVYLGVASNLRALRLRDHSTDLGVTIVPTFAAPREEIEIGLMPAALYESCPISALRPCLWDLGKRLYEGESINLQEHLGTQTEWLLLGPFPNENGQGFDTEYPPEHGVDLRAEYQGLNGTVCWTQFHSPDGYSAVDLARAFQPSESVCAYALCFVRSDTPRDVQIRAGANDAWKLWLGNDLIFQDRNDGRIILDRNIIPVMIPSGTTPILLKVCNNRKDWGFILRMTDAEGRPAMGVRLQSVR